MEFKFNVSGEARKALVKVAGSILGSVPIYKGAPTFAYVVNNVTISKDGVLSWDESADAVAIHDLLEKLKQHGYIAEAEEVAPDDYPNTLTIELSLEGFTDTALENLDRLIASKSALIKKAIGADALPVERTETTLKFPWFCFGIAPDEVSAYTRFIGALCAASKEQHRVTSKETPVENEKFAFRVFLIRLGFVGNEYKTARKILLRNLTGNSAFKNGTPKVTEDPANE